MQPRHGFSHSNETDQNGAKHHYWVQNGGLGALFHFWTETVHRFVNGPNRCIKCNPGMVSRTATKLTKTNKTSLLGPKRWIGCVRFVSGPKLCIVSLTGRTGALNTTPAWFLAQQRN